MPPKRNRNVQSAKPSFVPPLRPVVWLVLAVAGAVAGVAGFLASVVTVLQYFGICFACV